MTVKVSNQSLNTAKVCLGTHCASLPLTTTNVARAKAVWAKWLKKIFFGYDKNSNPDADFPVAGVELKCTEYLGFAV